MQNVTTRYHDILSAGNYRTEVKVVINGVEYDESWLSKVEIESGVFSDDQLTIGGAYCGSCMIELYSEQYTGQQLSAMIPTASEIKIYERLRGYVNGAEVVDNRWLIQGVYFIDLRDSVSWTGKLRLSGVDRMALADALYPSTTASDWPKSTYAVVQEIAATIGVQLDSETASVLSGTTYQVQLPSAYTMREVLGYIATMYCGNFYITKDGKLMLLQVNSLPEETNLLINEIGQFITVGGDYIYV